MILIFNGCITCLDDIFLRRNCLDDFDGSYD